MIISSETHKPSKVILSLLSPSLLCFSFNFIAPISSFWVPLFLHIVYMQGILIPLQLFFSRCYFTVLVYLPLSSLFSDSLPFLSPAFSFHPAVCFYRICAFLSHLLAAWRQSYFLTQTLDSTLLSLV